jgi:hypothetical protein
MVVRYGYYSTLQQQGVVTQGLSAQCTGTIWQLAREAKEGMAGVAAGWGTTLTH